MQVDSPSLDVEEEDETILEDGVKPKSRGPGRPKKKDTADLVMEKLGPRLSIIESKFDLLDQLAHLSPLLTSIDSLRGDIAFLITENKRLTQQNQEQCEKINNLERHINTVEMQKISEDRFRRRNTVIVHGFPTNVPEAEILNTIKAKIPEVPASKILNVEKIGKPTLTRRPVKLSFNYISSEEKRTILKSNKGLKAAKESFWIDSDRSPNDHQMNKALLEKRYELKQENQSVHYYVQNNLLVDANGPKFYYNFITQNVIQIKSDNDQ